MKKSLVVFLALLIAMMSGCSFIGGKTDTTQSNNEGIGSATVASNVNDQPGFNSEEIVKNIKVKSYTYSSYSYNYLILVLKNNSKFDCKLNVSIDLYDSKNKIVGTEDSTVQAFSAGTETLVKFSTKDKFKKFEYELAADELTYYTSVTGDLKCKVNTATDKIIVTVKNKGKKTAEYTKANAIFFKNKKVVYSNLAFVGDSKNLIKPGKSENAQISCYEKFDSVKVYLDGYAKANEN